MDPKQVFVSIAVVFVGITAMLFWTNDLAASYNTEGVGESFNNTMTRIELLGNITDIGAGVGESTQAQEGAGIESSTDNLVTRSLTTLSLINVFMGLVPDLFTDAAIILGVPEVYSRLAGFVFAFVFGITIMFILILGARKLIG